MTIESSIDNVANGLNAIAAARNNIAAALNNIAAALAGKGSLPEAAFGPEHMALLDKKKKPQTAATAPAATAPTATAPDNVQEVKGANSAEEPGSEIDFVTQIQKPIIALAGSGRRETALKILKQFGATKAGEIKPADYAAAAAAIAAVNDPAA